MHSGARRLKRDSAKNIKLLAGKPLVAYTIEAARASHFITGVYVSTDDQEITDVAREYGAEVIRRPAELASDTAPSESALLHFAEMVPFDILVFLQCTSPFTKTEDLNQALERFLKGGFDSMLSVCENRLPFLWNKKGESVNYDHQKRPRRQELQETFCENGAFYITTRNWLLSSQNRLNGKIGTWIMPPHRSIDIDTPEDFELLHNARYILDSMKP